MATYLLTYNPDKYDWQDRDGELRKIERSGQAGGVVEGRWSVARKHGIAPGDDVYLLRQNDKPRGIIASGKVSSSPYPDTHWSEPGKFIDYVDVHWVRAVPHRDPLRLGLLKRLCPEQHWTPQQSGTKLQAQYEDLVSEHWAAHLKLRRRP